MKSPHAFQTKTMGDLYCKQGYIDDAMDVYISILAKNPERIDCHEALDLCKAIVSEKKQKKDGLSELMAEWIGLVCKEAGL